MLGAIYVMTACWSKNKKSSQGKALCEDTNENSLHEIQVKIMVTHYH